MILRAVHYYVLFKSSAGMKMKTLKTVNFSVFRWDTAGTSACVYLDHLGNIILKFCVDYYTNIYFVRNMSGFYLASSSLT